MANYVNPKSPDFFQQFHDNCIPKNEQFGEYVISRNILFGVSIERKNCWIFYRILRWLNPFLRLNLHDNVTYLNSFIEAHTDKYVHFLGGKSAGEKQVYIRELVASGKICRFVQRLLKHEVQIASKKKGSCQYALEAAKEIFKKQRLDIIFRLAKLAKTTPLAAALEHGFVDEAMKHITSDSDLCQMKVYFPSLMCAAFERKKWPLVFRLIALGADYTVLNISTDELLKEAITARHEKATAVLLADCSKTTDIHKRLKDDVELKSQQKSIESLLQVCDLCLFLQRVLEGLSLLLELQQYCQTLSMELLGKVAGLQNKSLFQVAIERNFLELAVNCVFKKEELAKMELALVRMHFQPLLGLAYKKKNDALMHELIAEGADLLDLPIGKEELLRRAIEHNHKAACITLVPKVSATDVIRICLAAVKANGILSAVETVHLCKQCHFLQHMLSDCVKVNPELKHDLTESILQFKRQRFILIAKRAEFEGKSPFKFAVEYGLIREAVSLPSSKEELLEAKGHYIEFMKECYRKNDFRRLLDVIALGAPLNTLEISQDELLEKAILIVHEEACLALVKQGASCSLQVCQGTLLHEACKHHMRSLTLLLLQKVPDLVNAQDSEEMTPLHYASFGNDPDIVRQLLEHSGCPAKKNRHKQTALSPVDLGQRVGWIDQKKMYKALFSNYGTLIKALEQAENRRAWERALVANCSEIVTEAKKQQLNPLEVAFILQDRVLMRALSTCLCKEEYAFYVEVLEKKFSQSDLSLVYYSPYEVIDDHFSKGLTKLQVEKPLQEVPLRELLELLNSLPELLQAEYRPFITKMIEKVEKKEVYTGTPKKDPALSEFYNVVSAALQNLILELSKRKKATNFQANLQEIFEQLSRAAGLCGGQLRTTPTLLYLKYCKNVVLSDEDTLYQALTEYRSLLVEGVFADDAQGVHSWNHFVSRRGKELGLPGYVSVQAIDEPYNGDRDNHDEIERDFRSLYTAQNIVEHGIAPRLQSELQEVFVEWQKAHLPQEWQKERFDAIVAKVAKLEPDQAAEYLAQEVGFLPTDTIDGAILRERQASYLGTWVYNLQTDAIKKMAILDMLQQLGVLAANYAEKNGPKHGFLGWITTQIPGGFFTKLSRFF